MEASKIGPSILILDQFSRVTCKEPTLHTRKLSFSWRGSPPLLPTVHKNSLPLVHHAPSWKTFSPRAKRLRTGSHPNRTKHSPNPMWERATVASTATQEIPPPPTTPPCPPAPLEVPQSPGAHQAPWRSLAAHQAAAY